MHMLCGEVVCGMVALTLLCVSRSACAQGEGPRVYLPVPVGTQRIVPTYMDISSSFNLRQAIFLRGADVRSNVGVLTYARFFGVRRQLSQVYASAIYGGIGGSTVRVVNGARTSVQARRQTGFANPLVGVVVGLTGTPALAPAAFASHTQTLQVYGLLGVAPGFDWRTCSDRSRQALPSTLARFQRERVFLLWRVTCCTPGGVRESCFQPKLAAMGVCS
jgi:hypothetical protein